MKKIFSSTLILLLILFSIPFTAYAMDNTENPKSTSIITIDDDETKHMKNREMVIISNGLKALRTVFRTLGKIWIKTATTTSGGFLMMSLHTRDIIMLITEILQLNQIHF